MPSLRVRCRDFSLRLTALNCAILATGLGLSGCGNHSSEQALDAQLQALNLHKVKLAKFAGKVTVDGQPPSSEQGEPLLVMLYNRKEPDKNKPPLAVDCRKDGSFEFYTYVPGDGVPEGSYVVLFAQLSGAAASGRSQPDALKNLYNDPDKNAQDQDFVVELKSPGKSNYAFDLKVAIEDPGKPGPHAVTEFRKSN
jgi:hypothetical protein